MGWSKMFLVLNKEKISAYVVSILTVCFLFFIASNTTKNNIENTETTSVKVEVNNEDDKEENDNVTNMNNKANSGNTIQKYNSTY